MEPPRELLKVIWVLLPVQRLAVLFVMVVAGLGLMVTIYVKGVPLQLMFEGVNA